MTTIIKKRPAMSPENDSAPKRQNNATRSDVRPLPHPYANIEMPPAVSDREHECRMRYFMMPLVINLAESVQRAYVDDLEQQMGRDDLSEYEQRECAEFLHTMLEEINTYLFNEDTDWYVNLISNKPRGAWYRRWLDGYPHLLNWAKSGVDNSEFGEHLRAHGPSFEQRERLATQLFKEWKLRKEKETVCRELDLKAKMHAMHAKQPGDVKIDGIDTAKGVAIDWQRLQDECVLTWKYRDLMLDSSEVDPWLEKRRKLAMSPCDYSALTVIRWRDDEGNSCGARLFEDGLIRQWVDDVDEGRSLNTTFHRSGSISYCSRPLKRS